MKPALATFISDTGYVIDILPQVAGRLLSYENDTEAYQVKWVKVPMVTLMIIHFTLLRKNFTLLDKTWLYYAKLDFSTQNFTLLDDTWFYYAKRDFSTQNFTT